MEPSPEEKLKQSSGNDASKNEKEFSLEEIEQHNKPDDAWLILVSMCVRSS
jgi:hypothetical protein